MKIVLKKWVYGGGEGGNFNFKIEKFPIRCPGDPHLDPCTVGSSMAG